RLPLHAVNDKTEPRDADKLQSKSVFGLQVVPPPNLAGVKVLTIDDAADSREMLKIVLEKFGADVMTAGSAREGFELLAGWKPDVLVCDIGMPDEDGYSLIQRIRKLDPAAGGKTPAVAL